jgi:hypothetical protein
MTPINLLSHTFVHVDSTGRPLLTIPRGGAVEFLDWADRWPSLGGAP